MVCGPKVAELCALAPDVVRSTSRCKRLMKVLNRLLHLAQETMDISQVAEHQMLVLLVLGFTRNSQSTAIAH
jgi:hypothetical protein